MSARIAPLDVAFLLSCALHAVVKRLSRLWERDETLWVFGARGGEAFVDNAKYLYLHAQTRHEVRPVWLTRDREVVAELDQQGFEAYHARSLRGVVVSLRAGIVFVTHGLGDVNLPCAGGATAVNLWHGIPLKRVGWDAERSKMPLPLRLAYEYLDREIDHLTVTSDAVVDPLASGLRVEPDRMFVSGYPRNDVLSEDVPGMGIGTDTTTIRRVRRLAARGRVIVYLPTFREFTEEAVDDAIDFAELDAFLAARDAYFLIKAHPKERLTVDESSLSRVVTLPPHVDVYPLLRHTDVLLTDYSSILFDYLLTDGRLVFYPYDLERYRAVRTFYFEYDDVTPGPVARTFEELLDALAASLEGTDEFGDERRAVRERFFAHPPGGAAARVFDRFAGR